jgi:alkylation response protein AidB-like acyl-CoA dehydrogenase
MSDTLVKSVALNGGSFIVQDSTPEETFIPEQLGEEALMVKSMIQDFLENDVFPNRTALEKQKEGLAVGLLEKMGELGLLGTHMPEIYGGTAMDTNTNTMICDALGPAGGFTVSYAVQTGIGMLPFFYFGTEEQKAQYLPDLISGKLKCAYCLTEPSSGSDALAAKTRADLTPDGKHYLINGQKMWISNGGWADLLVVFAKIDGAKFTGFIIDSKAEGVSLGAEEDKLGIKGSSTRQIFFENVKVPVENVLGAVGKGHLIAFNVLNVGRFKLGALCLGGAKAVASMGTKYAVERQQFKVSISTFGAIQHKLGEMAIRLFVGDSSQYRISNLMQEHIHASLDEGKSYADATLEAAEEYSIECALIKFIGSEVLDYVVDENLQIHGGIGFSEELGAARAYRDSRINRIYEGTNEINRLLAVDMLLKKAMKGAIDIATPAWAVQKELASMPSFGRPTGEYGEEYAAVKDFKKIILMVAGGAVKMQMDGKLDLRNEQEILMNVADMMAETFNCESALLRVHKLAGMSEKKQPQHIYDAVLEVQMSDATARMTKWATDALTSFAEGDLLKTFLMGLKRFTKYPPVNVKTKRRAIAQAMIDANEYCF